MRWTLEKCESHGWMKGPAGVDSKEIFGAIILGAGGDETIHCMLDIRYPRDPHAWTNLPGEASMEHGI